MFNYFNFGVSQYPGVAWGLGAGGCCQFFFSGNSRWTTQKWSPTQSILSTNLCLRNKNEPPAISMLSNLKETLCVLDLLENQINFDKQIFQFTTNEKFCSTLFYHCQGGKKANNRKVANKVSLCNGIFNWGSYFIRLKLQGVFNVSPKKDWPLVNFH